MNIIDGSVNAIVEIVFHSILGNRRTHLANILDCMPLSSEIVYPKKKKKTINVGRTGSYHLTEENLYYFKRERPALFLGRAVLQQ